MIPARRSFQRLEAGLDPSVKLVRLDDNKGWGGALNVVLRRWLQDETNPYCLISAHDARPDPDCLRLLVAAADADPRVGIACPQYPDPFIYPALALARHLSADGRAAGERSRSRGRCAARDPDAGAARNALMRSACSTSVISPTATNMSWAPARCAMDGRWFSSGDPS